LMDLGFAVLIDADKIEDLSRMYILLNRINSLNELKLFFGSYIKVSRFRHLRLSIRIYMYFF
jgi:cullin 4